MKENIYWNKIKTLKTFYCVDHEEKFSKLQMWIFILLAILIPIIVSFVLSIFVYYVPVALIQNNYRDIVNYVKIFSIGLSSLPFIIGNFKKFFLKRQYIYFLQYPIINIFIIIVSTILVFIYSFFSKENKYYSDVLSIIITIYQIIIILLFAIKNKIFINWFKKAFNRKETILTTIVLVSIGFGIFWLLQFSFSFIPKLIDKNAGNNSANQGSLNQMKNTILGTISLFFSAVIVAPILEEILYRYFISYFCNGSIYGYLFSTLLFASLHVMSRGDYVQIFPYFALGIVNGFIYYRYKNLTPCILIHFIGNLSSFIFILINK